MTRPFAPPRRMSPDLVRVQAYWEGLLRGSAKVPFADDLDLSALPDLSGRLFVVGVFNKPERFRIDLVGEELTTAFGQEAAGLFADEIAHVPPFKLLASQCSATIEAAAPTWFEDNTTVAEGYRRLLLPLWGDGRISMLLGVVDQGAA